MGARDSTATSNLDYQTARGTVTSGAGETAKTITLQIVGDTAEEAYENFLVSLSDPTGGAGPSQVTITNTGGSTDRSRHGF